MGLSARIFSVLLAGAVSVGCSPIEPNELGVAGGYRFTSDTGSKTSTSFATADDKTVVYLNRYGGLFIPAGQNDSILNTSSLLDTPAVIFPWLVNDSDWDNMMACVSRRFEPFHVEITDDEPFEGDYVEAVIAGHPSDIGQPEHIGGLAPFRLDCGVLDSAVVFAFAELYGDDHERLCDVAVQEIAHAYGLDHQMNCTDPMSYLGGCGEKLFRNEDARCGEREERDCACGDARQNSMRLLSERLGDAETPNVALASPSTGEAVNPNFYVTADADDNVEVERVELVIDGKLVQSRSTRPFVFEVTGLDPGEHQIALRAYDSENEAQAQGTIMIDPSVPEAPSPVSLDQLGADELGDGGCQSGGTPGSGWIYLLLAAFFLRRKQL